MADETPIIGSGRTICECGLAKEYHDPRYRPANFDEHEYRPVDTAPQEALAAALAGAMDEAYLYKDPDNDAPVLPFVDDYEGFWKPFGVRVAAELAGYVLTRAEDEGTLRAARKDELELLRGDLALVPDGLIRGYGNKPDPFFVKSGKVERADVLRAIDRRIDRLAASQPDEPRHG